MIKMSFWHSVLVRDFIQHPGLSSEEEKAGQCCQGRATVAALLGRLGVRWSSDDARWLMLLSASPEKLLVEVCGG